MQEPQAMTPDQFDSALAALEWKASDFCRRVGLVPNTVWRWRKSLAPVPLWVGEYLRAMLAMKELADRFLKPLPTSGAPVGPDQAE